MADDESLLHLALSRGWITAEQVRSGRPLSELLSPEQLSELKAGQDVITKILGSGFLSPDDLPEQVPARFGRYEILRPLGEGATGRVFLARDPEIGREVAIKILERVMARTFDRFKRETQILGTLNHPNVVVIYDSGTQDGRPYYAMKYVGDRSLADGWPPLRQSVEILEQVARGCQAAHDKGVIHRDLKPANILIGDCPVIVDFGIAKVVDAELTDAGQTLGTPYYMSPEQALGRRVDARTDIYSLGVMLYEAMTGRRPFTGDSVLEITRRIGEEEPVAPRGIKPDLPRDLEVIALKAMEKDPHRRYGRALDLAWDLRAWLEGRMISARPPSPAERLIAAARRRPRVLLVAAACLAFLVGGALLLASLGSPPPGASVEERRRLESARRVILQEALAIQKWEVNLYRPARQIPYGELERSVATLRPVAGENGLSPALRQQACFAIAKAHLFMGRMEEALADFGAAIDAGAGDRAGESHFERARIRWEYFLRESLSRNREKADALLKRVIRDLRAGLAAGFRDDWVRDFARALLHLAEHRSGGPTDETLRRFEALRSAPDKPVEEVAKVTGDLYLLEKRPDRAIGEYSQAVSVRECYVQAYNGLALAHMLGGSGSGNIQEALKNAFTAIDINPAYEDSYLMFALASRAVLAPVPRRVALPEGVTLEYALEVLEKLREGSRLRPDSQKVLVAHGMACVVWSFMLMTLQQDPGEAVREAVGVLERAARIDGSALEPWLGMGIAHLGYGTAVKEAEKEEWALASACLKRALETAPNSPDVHCWIGAHRSLAGDSAGAREAWRKALELDPALRGRLEGFIRELEERR